ncbi:acyl-CoA synthetase [bacterium]|nr:acyl-CoA synthetase [bacterium]
MKHHTVYAKTKPDAPAIIMVNSGEIITCHEYSYKVNQIAQYFKKIGLKEKDNIAVLLENCDIYMEIINAAFDAGLLITNISTHLKLDEAEYVINNCEAKLLITSERFSELAKQLYDCTPLVAHHLMLGATIDGYDSFEEIVAHYKGVPIDYNISGTFLLYSSGTTGRPKGIKWEVPDIPVGTMDPALEGMCALFQINDKSVYLSTQPLYHSAPAATALGVLQTGATVVIMEKFDAENALSAIEKYQVTHSQWVPTMFVRILKLHEKSRTKYNLSSLQCAIHAAAPCPVEVKDRMIEWWGPILFEFWGGTETSLVTFITSPEWLEHKGSVGRGFTATIHIMDENGNELPHGEPGVIYLEGGRDYSYLKEPEKTASDRNEKGWTNIGDIGYLDEEGYLYLTDRKSFMIISGGVNIYPQETEDILVMHPKVVDVAVIGVPNEEFGEEVKAVVQPVDMAEAGPELAEELIEYCKSRISTIKCPRSVDFMSELPRTPAGKLLKRLIKDNINPAAQMEK